MITLDADPVPSPFRERVRERELGISHTMDSD